MDFSEMGNQSSHVTGKLRACFFVFGLHMSKKSSTFAAIF